MLRLIGILFKVFFVNQKDVGIVLEFGFVGSNQVCRGLRGGTERARQKTRVKSLAFGIDARSLHGIASEFAQHFTERAVRNIKSLHSVGIVNS